MDIELSSMKGMIQDILKVTASRKVEEVAVIGPPADDAQGIQGPPLPPKMTCADVVQDASPRTSDGEWSVANRAKRGKPPAPRPPAAPAAAPGAAPGATSGAAPAPGAPVAAVATGAKPPQTAKSSAVIGAKKTGSIKAVATVKQFSIFMSRLQPGTGEDAVSSYVREQSGAEAVTAEKLPTRFDSYESYRLDITNPSPEVNLLDPQLWAQGLIVRRFFQKRRVVGAAPGGSMRESDC